MKKRNKQILYMIILLITLIIGMIFFGDVYSQIPRPDIQPVGNDGNFLFGLLLGMGFGG